MTGSKSFEVPKTAVGLVSAVLGAGGLIGGDAAFDLFGRKAQQHTIDLLVEEHDRLLKAHADERALLRAQAADILAKCSDVDLREFAPLPGKIQRQEHNLDAGR